MRSLLLSMAALALLVGCASPKGAQRVSDFSSGVVVTAKNVEGAFSQVESVHWRRQVGRAVADWKTRPVSPWTLSPFLSARESAARADVLDGLVAYAAALSSIANEGDQESPSDAVKALGQAILSIDPQDVLKYVPDSLASLEPTPAATAPATTGQTSLGPCAASIKALGSFLVRHERASDVAQVVSSMAPQVRTICRLLAADIGATGSGSIGSGASGLRAQVAKDYRDLVTYEDAAARSAPGPQAEAAVREMFDTVREAQQVDAALVLVQRSLLDLADAHDALLHAYEDQAPAVDAAIARLLADARRVQDSGHLVQGGAK